MAIRTDSGVMLRVQKECRVWSKSACGMKGGFPENTCRRWDRRCKKAVARNLRK
jgi:hypothetical protein